MPQRQQQITRYVNRPITMKTAIKAGVEVAKVAKKAYDKYKKTKTQQATSRATANNPGGGTNDFSKSSVKYGRKLKKSTYLNRVVLDNVNSTIFGDNVYNDFSVGTGAVEIINSLNTDSNVWVPPVNLWEINCAPNVITTTSGGSNIQQLIKPAMRWQPLFNSSGYPATQSNAVISWQKDTQSQVIKAPGHSTSIDIYPNEKALLEYYNFKSIFYAPTTMPTKITIELVRFKDRRLVPDDVENNGNEFCGAFWQQMIKAYARNPIDQPSTSLSKYMKVYKKWEFIMNPKESTDPSVTIMKQMNIFLRLNRKLLFAYDESVGVNATDDTPSLTENRISVIKDRVHPTGRLYLMIRAQARLTTGFNSQYHPSYDVTTRAKLTQLAN